MALLLQTVQDDNGRLRKIEGWVSFPFVLDVGGFCEPPSDGGPQQSARYQLLGVVEHRGESLRRARWMHLFSALRHLAHTSPRHAAHLALSMHRMRTSLCLGNSMILLDGP